MPDRRKAPSQSAHLSPSPLHATTAPLCTAHSPNRMRASAVCRADEPGRRPSAQWPRCRLPATSSPLAGHARPPTSPLSPYKKVRTALRAHLNAAAPPLPPPPSSSPWSAHPRPSSTSTNPTTSFYASCWCSPAFSPTTPVTGARRSEPAAATVALLHRRSSSDRP